MNEYLRDPDAAVESIAPVFGIPSADLGEWAIVLTSADGNTLQVASGPAPDGDPGQAARLLTLGAELAATAR